MALNKQLACRGSRRVTYQNIKSESEIFMMSFWTLNSKVSDRSTLQIDNVGEASPRHSVNRHRGHVCNTFLLILL